MNKLADKFILDLIPTLVKSFPEQKSVKKSIKSIDTKQKDEDSSIFIDDKQEESALDIASLPRYAEAKSTSMSEWAWTSDTTSAAVKSTSSTTTTNTSGWGLGSDTTATVTVPTASTGISGWVWAGGALAAIGIGVAAGGGGGGSTQSTATDTTAPVKPTISTVAGNDVISGAEKTAGVTVIGTAEAGSTVTVVWGATTKTAIATNGTYSVAFSSSEIPADGTINITATARDASNNTSIAATHSVTVDTLLVGYLIDSAVSGVDYYINGVKAGITDTNGKFMYHTGDTISFKVGNVTIGDVKSTGINTDSKVLLQDLVGVARTNLTDSTVVKIAQFLQTLDGDGNASNGITVDTTKLATNASGNLVTATINSSLFATNVTVVTADAALAHLGANVGIVTPVVSEGEFFQLDSQGWLGRVHINSTTASWTDYDYSNSEYTESGTGTISVTNVSVSGMTFLDNNGHIEEATFSNVKECLSIDGLQTTGLKEVTVTFKVISMPELSQVDWYQSFWNGHSYYNLATNMMDTIDTIQELKVQLVDPTWGAYLTVGDNVTPFGDNLDVKLIGASDATSGTLIKMVWNDTHTGKVPDYNQIVLGSWNMQTIDGTQYLIVETTGIEREVYKVDGINGIVKTEIYPTGSTRSEQWYFGTDFNTFKAIGQDLLGSINGDTIPPNFYSQTFSDSNDADTYLDHFTVTADQNLASENFSNNVNCNIVHNGVMLTAFVPTVMISRTDMIFNLGTNQLQNTDYVLFSKNSDVLTTQLGFTDNFGNFGVLWDTNEVGGAQGSVNTALINIGSTGLNLTGNYGIFNQLSHVDSVLTGNSDNNFIEGGSGHDIITGGRGADEIMTGKGNDILVFAQGDSTAVTYNDTNTAVVGLSYGDTFTFTNGADIVDLYEAVSGDIGTIQLASGLTKTTETTLGNQNFKMIEGWFDWSNSVFTTNTGGNSTLVIYDGDSSSGVSTTGLVIHGSVLNNISTLNNIITYNVL